MMDAEIPVWSFYAVLALLFAGLILQIHREIKRAQTPIEWWQFFATRRSDGQYRADVTKLGQVVGIVIASWVVVVISAKVQTVSVMEFCAVLGLYLAYVAGVAGYQEYMKSRRAPEAKAGGKDGTD